MVVTVVRTFHIDELKVDTNAKYSRCLAPQNCMRGRAPGVTLVLYMRNAWKSCKPNYASFKMAESIS